MSKKMKTLDVPVYPVLAASDGELNVAEAEHRGSSHSLNSNSSLPSMQCGHNPVGTVASWAVSFERLLEDPTGVLYFTAFLKSEVSAENILFWQACEKFRQIPANQKEELMREARSIYSTYLSSSASSAINIDDTARTEEGALEDPKPEMFNKAQQQIFKLMKFDSYTRFVRSQLYQNCMLADVEGKLLPDLGAGFKSAAYRKSGLMDSPSPGDAKKFSQQKKKARAGKSLPFNVEPGSDRRRGTPEGKAAHDKQREKRGSWGAELQDHVTVSRRESQCSVKSTSSVELGYLSVRGENGRSSPRPLEQERAGGAGRAEKYCCVFLPDGTASLTPARAGLSVRDMLVGLCEKRGFPLSDVIIYLQTKDKVSPQQPLSLDQDSAVLRDQQVTLELRVTFTLEVAFTGKAMGIMAKSSKTLAHTLASVLQKHQLRPQDAVVTMSGSKEPLNLSMSVFPLANKRLLLDRAKAKEQASSPKLTSQALPASQEGPAGPDGAEKPLPSAAVRNRTASKSKNAALRRACDIDGLIDLISKTQCFRVEDQRGLLRKEDLVIPPFLMQPRDQGGEGRTEKSRGETPPPQPAEAPPPACADSAPATAATSEDRSELGKPADGAEKTVPEPGTTSTGPAQRTGPPVCSRETTV